MSFKNIFTKLQSFFLNTDLFKKNDFNEPMFQFRGIVYINGLPFFLVSQKLITLKKKYVKFKICEYINPKSIKFVAEFVSGKIDKIDGNVEIHKVGPCGDVIEENIYYDVRFKKFDVNSYHFDMTSDDLPEIQLEFKSKKSKKIIN